jgi:hypothetical protein
MLDVNGKMVSPSVNVIAKETFVINTQNLLNGIYFVRISNDFFVETRKIMINRN